MLDFGNTVLRLRLESAHVDRTLLGYYIRLSRFEFANRIDCMRKLCALDRPASVRAGPTELAP